MKKVIISVLLLWGIFVVTSCCCQKKPTSSNTTTTTVNYEKDGFVKATVIKYAVDGCSFLLQLESGKKLEAVNLSADLKKEGQILWIKYTPETKMASICMAGEMVTLTDFKPVK